MSNNKQIEKPLELPHQETIVGTNTLQTKPFDNQKTMSNNKQSSLDYYITKLTEILGPEIIKQISRDDNERIARLEKQAKAMHKEEIEEAHFAPKYGCFSEQYYNETFGGNNEQQ